MMHLFRRLGLVFVVFFLISSNIHAETQPKFTIIAQTSTTINVVSNDTETVQYLVTNRTKVTRTLTLVPIQGITQISQGTNPCLSPFTLSPNQSCLLTLSIIGSQIPATGIHSAPKICKTNRGNNPDPLLCSQACGANTLNITVSPAAPLTVSPAELSLVEGSLVPKFLKVTNRSTTVTARNIRANLPAALSTVIQDASDCISLPPGGTCQLSFLPGTTLTTPLTTVPVQGTNTEVATFLMDVVSTQISVSPSLLKFFVGQTGTVTVTNLSTTNPALNVTATVPAGSPIVATVSPGCASIPALGSCTITFTSSQPTALTAIKIKGTDTTSEFVNVQVLQYAYIPNMGSNVISICKVAPNNTLPASGCSNFTTQPAPSDIVFNPAGTQAYISYFGTILTNVCNVDISSGALTNCQQGGPTPPNGFTGIAINPTGTFVYLVDTDSNTVFICPVQPGGGLPGNCPSTTTTFSQPYALTFNPDGTILYVTNFGNNTVSRCTVDLHSGNLGCVPMAPFTTPLGIAVNSLNTFAYVTDRSGNNVSVCTVGGGGVLAACTPTGNGFNNPTGIAVTSQDTFAYVTNFIGNTVSLCPIIAGGTFGSCGDSGAGPIFNNPNAIQFN